MELAISLMVIMLLLLGAVETSFALFQYVTIRDAAQEGAIYGSFTPTDAAGIRYHAVAAASDVLIIDPNEASEEGMAQQPGTVSVDIDGSPCEGIEDGKSNSVIVTVTFPHKIAFPLITPVLGTDTINLTASVTNTILSPACTP